MAILQTIEREKTRESEDSDDKGKVTVECSAAYVLARDIHLIDGWLFAVRRMADREFPIWDWTRHQELFSSSYGVPPTHYFASIDDALYDLASAGRLNASILVELHRALDSAAESCTQLAKLARMEEDEKIRADSFSFGKDLNNAMWLMQRVLQGKRDEVDSWMRIGDGVGKLTAEYGRRSDDWYIRTIHEILEEVEMIGSADVAKLREMPIPRPTNGKIADYVWKDTVRTIDELLTQSFDGAMATEAWIVFDDQRKVLTYLGVPIPFDEFSDKVGLSIYRVLVQHPGESFSTPQILKLAKSGAEPSRTKNYLTHFRNVLKVHQSKWWARFRDGPYTTQARMGFVRHDSHARKLAASKETYYRLDVPGDRVVYNPLAMPS